MESVESSGVELAEPKDEQMASVVNSEIHGNFEEARGLRRVRLGARSPCLSPLLFLVPLLLVSLPVKLPNSVAQPLTLILLFPFLLSISTIALKRRLFWLLVVGTILTSLYQVVANQNYESSAYQAVRASAPFFVICMIISAYRDILSRVANSLKADAQGSYKIIHRCIFLFSLFCAIQSASFLAGFSLANVLSMSESNRVMIFQTSSCVLLLYYAITQRKYFVLTMLSIVIVATGSKAIFASAVAVGVVALFASFSVGIFIRLVVASVIFGGALYYVNPVVVERMLVFIENDEGEAFQDDTRAYEIEHAQKTLNRAPVNWLFGMGFAAQLTPGVPTLDPSWAENSKYDIENAYWGVFAKLGIVFSVIFFANALLNVPATVPILVVICVQAIMSLKTSYQIFCYMDGVCILLWSIAMHSALLDRSVNRRNISPERSVSRRTDFHKIRLRPS